MASVANVCEICKLSDSDDYDFGGWKSSDGFTIHYFCALLSTNSVQRGKDEEGILGFLVKDLEDLAKLHKKTPCVYCKGPRASVRCANSKCTRYFHLVCGIRKNCLFKFNDPFRSYCHDHVEIKEKVEVHQNNWSCQICKEPMGAYNPLTSIPSCCNHGFFHKQCIQKCALSAGSVMKCPCCGNDPEGYQNFVRERGIFVPEKDADWELSNNAFQSLLYKHNQCDAADCICPRGSNHCAKSGRWSIHVCTLCGANGIHVKCRKDNPEEPFQCGDCVALLNPDQSQSVPQNEVAVEIDATDTEEDTGVDHNYNQNPMSMNDRVNMFFDRSDFSLKPRPPLWLV